MLGLCYGGLRSLLLMCSPGLGEDNQLVANRSCCQVGMARRCVSSAGCHVELALELDPNAGRHCGILELPEGHLGRNLASFWVWCCGVFPHRPNLTRRLE